MGALLHKLHGTPGRRRLGGAVAARRRESPSRRLSQVHTEEASGRYITSSSPIRAQLLQLPTGVCFKADVRFSILRSGPLQPQMSWKLWACRRQVVRSLSLFSRKAGPRSSISHAPNSSTHLWLGWWTDCTQSLDDITRSPAKNNPTAALLESGAGGTAPTWLLATAAPGMFLDLPRITGLGRA